MEGAGCGGCVLLSYVVLVANIFLVSFFFISLFLFSFLQLHFYLCVLILRNQIMIYFVCWLLSRFALHYASKAFVVCDSGTTIFCCVVTMISPLQA